MKIGAQYKVVIWYIPVVLTPNQYAEQSQYILPHQICPFPHFLAPDMHQECQSGYSCLISLVSKQLNAEMWMYKSF